LRSFIGSIYRARHFVFNLSFVLSLLSFNYWFISIILNMIDSLLLVERLRIWFTRVCFDIKLASILTIFLRLCSKRIMWLIFTVVSDENSRIHLLFLWENIIIANRNLVLVKNSLSFIHPSSFWIYIRQNPPSSFFTMVLFEVLFVNIMVFNSFVLPGCLIRGLHWCSFLMDVVHHHA